VIRQDEAFFRTVIEHASDVIAVIDLDGNILHISPAVEKVTGRNAAALQGTKFLNLILAEDRPAAEERFQHLRRNPGMRKVCEARFARLDGAVRVLECVATHFTTPSGDGAITINARDVTERSEQERTLRESSARLTLLNAVARIAHFGAPAGTIVKSTLQHLAEAFPGMHAVYSTVDENNFLVIQEAAGPVGGVQAEGHSIDLSLVPDILASFEQGRIFTVEDIPPDPRVQPVARDASSMNVRAAAVVPLTDLGKLKGTLALACPDRHVWTTHETTTLSEVGVYLSLALNEEAAQRDRRHAELALQQSEAQLRQTHKMEAIGRLAGGIAHDFNNLLTAILGYGELIAGAIGDHPSARDVEQILEAGRRAAALTRQLLAFARQQTLAAEVLCPNEIVKGTAQLLERLLGHDVELRLDIDESVGNITVDRSQLEQVLLNLALNARDAMPEGGRLTIGTKSVVLDAAQASAALAAPGPHVLVEVSDTGVGMDRATLARIFEPFFTTKDQAHGTGLGLATVYGVVTQSGGGVEVESALGAGTTFRLYFPATEETDQTEDARAIEEGGLVVLIIETDPAARTAARKHLVRAGHTLLEATALDKAVAIAERNPVDVLLVGAAGEDSTAALRDALRVRRPKLRVALLPPLPFTGRMLLERIEQAEPSTG
jgi:PAS domain S-box-containing protein